MPDPTSPDYYRKHPSGIECITISEWFSSNIGQALQYLWRAGIKTPDPIPDLRKAVWFITREIARIEAMKE